MNNIFIIHCEIIVVKLNGIGSFTGLIMLPLPSYYLYYAIGASKIKNELS